MKRNLSTSASTSSETTSSPVEDIAHQLQSRLAKERVQALDALQRADLPAVLAPVLVCLRHRSAAVRASSADCLGRLEWAEAADALLPLLADDVAEVRCSAAESLGTLLDSTRKCPPALLDLLNDSDEFCRLIAVESMGLIGDRKVLDPLWMKIDDPEPLVRRNVAAVIGELGRKSDRPRLRRLLREEPSEVARAGILEGLYELGEPAVLTQLLQLLQSPDYVVQCFVANALAEIDLNAADAQAARSGLRAAMKQDVSPAAREAFEAGLKGIQRRLARLKRAAARA